MWNDIECGLVYIDPFISGLMDMVAANASHVYVAQDYKSVHVCVYVPMYPSGMYVVAQ